MKILTSNPGIMKIFTCTLAMLLLTVMAFSQAALCPAYFKRNNGQGTCGIDGQLRLTYNTCPPYAPIIDSVITNGVKANVVFALPDTTTCQKFGYVSYCVIGGNMPPASLWMIYFHTSVDANKFGCLVPEGGVLPIVINSFSAARSSENIVLNWQVSANENIKSFEIEKSNGKGYMTIAEINASGKGNGNAYHFEDLDNSTTTNDYRLKVIGMDGSYTYSAVRSVKGKNGGDSYTIFPNPARGNSNITVAGISEPTDVQVMDNSGRILKTITVNNYSTVKLNGLQKGLYMIRIINRTSGIVSIKKLTIVE